jgi:hypothetical protein
LPTGTFRKPLASLNESGESARGAFSYGVRSNEAGIEIKGTSLYSTFFRLDAAKLTLEAFKVGIGEKEQTFIGIPLGVAINRKNVQPMGIPLASVRPMVGLMGQLQGESIKVKLSHQIYYTLEKMKAQVDTEEVKFETGKITQTELGLTVGVFFIEADLSVGRYQNLEGVFHMPMGDAAVEVGPLTYAAAYGRFMIGGNLALVYGGNKVFNSYQDKNLYYVVGARYLEKSRDAVSVGLEIHYTL